MSTDFQCHITINNRMHDHLRFKDKNEDYGEFSKGPEQDIPPQTVVEAFVATGSPWVPSGTSGTVSYQIGDDATRTLTIKWDIPAVGANTVQCDLSDPNVAAQMTGFNGHGDTEACIIKVAG